MPDRYESFCSFRDATDGRPRVVSDDAIDENGEADAPDGASTGAEAVVNAAGAVVWAHALQAKRSDKIRQNAALKSVVNMIRAND